MFDTIKNFQLLGYKTIKFSHGEVLAKRPSGELTLFNKYLEVVWGNIEYMAKLAEGVYLIESDNKVTIFNERYGNITLDSKYKNREEIHICYIGNHYICEDYKLRKVEIYNTEGLLITCVEDTEIVNVIVQHDKLCICLYDLLTQNIYKIAVIDIITREYSMHTIESALVSNGNNVDWNVRYFGNNKIVMLDKDALYIYNIENQEFKEIDGFSCKDYLISVSSLWSTELLTCNDYLIVNEIKTNMYYLMDEKGKMKHINTSMIPRLYYNGYYIVKDTNNKQFLLDNQFNVISKEYDNMEFISEHEVIALYKKNVFILDIKTMEEKLIAENSSYYYLHSDTDEIYIGTGDARSDFCVSINGEFLYTTDEYKELLEIKYLSRNMLF